MCDPGRVLGGNHHIGDLDRGLSVEAHGDLGLCIRAQPRNLLRLSELGKKAHHPMGKRNGQRHQLRRMAGCKSKHQTLVARTKVGAVIDTLGNVSRLFSNQVEDRQTVRVKTAQRVCITDLANRFDCHLFDVHLGI